MKNVSPCVPLVGVVTGGMLASCDTRVGVSPALKVTYWRNAAVTKPDGGSPQVVRRRPPQNFNPSQGHR